MPRPPLDLVGDVPAEISLDRDRQPAASPSRGDDERAEPDSEVAGLHPSAAELDTLDLATHAAPLAENEGRFFQRTAQGGSIGEAAGGEVADRVRRFGELAPEPRFRFEEHEV